MFDRMPYKLARSLRSLRACASKLFQGFYRFMMTPLLHIAFVCASTLAFALACINVERPQTAAAPATNLSFAAAPTLLPADEPQDGGLSNTRRADQSGRDAAGGQLPRLSADEHMTRAAVYHTNRAFAEAREHWQAVITRYPNDAKVPAAYFGIGRSLFQERRYQEALPVFQKLGENYPNDPAGRDGFYYVAATLLRLGRAAEAAARYSEYTVKYPTGERVENAFLNAIDSWREAGRPAESLTWIARTRERFRGMPAETNAVFARLRLDVAGGDWASAVRTADELGRMSFASGVGTTPTEVAYLRAYSLERAGQKEQAIRAYQSIPDGANSYYGGLATTRLIALGGAAKTAGTERANRVRSQISSAAASYPAPFRETILRSVRGRKVDPRLMLSIMRQESNFNPRARSNAAARGLMQFVVDVAAKYAPRVKLTSLREDDLYRPEVSILLASEYLDELTGMFPGLPEAVAASYNGGEDNVARWVKRAGHDDAGVFTSEIGFSESKDYAAKVMANYRAYRQLYTEDLRPRR